MLVDLFQITMDLLYLLKKLDSIMKTSIRHPMPVCQVLRKSLVFPTTFAYAQIHDRMIFPATVSTLRGQQFDLEFGYVAVVLEDPSPCMGLYVPVTGKLDGTGLELILSISTLYCTHKSYSKFHYTPPFSVKKVSVHVDALTGNDWRLISYMSSSLIHSNRVSL
tara:strand:+ start:1030 stop:1521 length:492 start_codon:yes stop_codon:yes gene_type:complete